ncbi:methyl farnesoate epoxidase-like [Amphibalanus amphitrite]|uniref:methyl farnesoate epoxidase-like n=1 Tax=Amphibalanus amphitrite TaxID=1232801 RepID=UPI001C92233E|nr:methyl farnesoate epoxidase-like [Amphibalanus amphitrite]
MLLALAALVFLVLLLVVWPRRPAGGPPGPTPVPVLGTLAFLGARTRTELFNTLQTLSERYGHVVGFFAGATYHVYVEGLAAARRAMAEPAAHGRAAGSAQMALSFGRPRGVIVAEGDRWRTNSAFLYATLEEMISSGEAERFICEELTRLCDRLRLGTGSAVPVQSLFRQPYVALSWRIVTGCRLPEQQAQRLTALLAAELAGLQNGWVDSPLLRRLAPERSGYADVLRFRDELRATFAATVSDSRYRDGTLVARLRAKRGPGWRPADDQDLVMFLFDFLNAGCETTSSFGEWSLLYLLREPAELGAVRAELDTLGFLARGADMVRLPRTRAFLSEVMRRSSLTPASVPHRATAPLTIEGFSVPEDAVLRYGIQSTHWDGRLWPQPELFRSQRFLRDGQFVSSDDLAPYGVGARRCTGRRLAELYTFLMVSWLVQQLDVMPPPGQMPPDEDAEIALTRNCLPYRAVFRPRADGGLGGVRTQ